MDLSFPGFNQETEVLQLPPDLAALMVGIAARQRASQTAAVQAQFGRLSSSSLLLEPLDGAFNGPMAMALVRWRSE